MPALAVREKHFAVESEKLKKIFDRIDRFSGPLIGANNDRLIAELIGPLPHNAKIVSANVHFA